ncbi:hypothetical protein O6H91_12G058800 [Diphasiastrum complanatum]|nr:hypothetical protein O6H91_12G058800 [Diphasiastrum complanatum]
MVNSHTGACKTCMASADIKHGYLSIAMAPYCSGVQTSHQRKESEDEDVRFLRTSRLGKPPDPLRWQDEHARPSFDDIHPKRDTGLDLAITNSAREQYSDNGYVRTVVQVLNVLKKTDDMSAKLAQFSGKLSAHDFVIVLKVMRDTRLAFSFFSWFKQQPAYTPELNTFMAVVRCLLHDAKWEKLGIIVEEMYDLKFYLNSHMFCTIIKEASAKGRTAVSEKWFARMKEMGIKLDLSGYNTMMLVYNKAGKFSEVYALFREMVQNNVSPNIVSYCHLLSACKSTRNVEEAERLFRLMKDQGVAPDLVAFTLLLEVYGNEGKIEQLRVLMDEMRMLGIAPDARTYTCLINAYAKAEMLDLVSEVFEDCHKTGRVLDEMFYISMIRVYCQANKYKQAEEVVKFMQDNRIPVNELCYSTIIAAYAKAGRWKTAIKVFKTMKSSPVKVGEELNLLMLSIYLQARQFQPCEELYKNMLLRGQNRNVAAYEIMIKVYEQTNRSAQISEIFSRMKSNLCVGNISIYNKLIDLFGGAMNTSMVDKVFEEMKLVKVRPTSDTYFLLLGAYLKAGEYQNAISLYTHMKESGFPLEARLIEIMVAVLTKAGKLDEAEKMSTEKN